jgi:hypothetical protein
LKKPGFIKLETDPIFKISQEVSRKLKELREENEKDDYGLSKGYRLLVSGMMEMDADRNFYSDANSTLRLSYGSIRTIIQQKQFIMIIIRH